MYLSTPDCTRNFGAISCGTSTLSTSPLHSSVASFINGAPEGWRRLTPTQDKRRVFLRITQKILRQLRRTNDEFDPRRREIAPPWRAVRQKRSFLHQHIRRKKDRYLVARLAGRHALQGQMPPQLLCRAFKQAFPLLCHCTSPTPSVSFAEGLSGLNQTFQETNI